MAGEKKHFVTCGQMKILEKRADKTGLSYRQMMENAGSAAAEIIMAKTAYRSLGDMERAREDIPAMVAEGAKGAEPFTDSLCATVFCGKGNNGGDGFVVARVLDEAGWNVTVVLVDGEPVTEDSIYNFRLISGRGIKIINMNENSRALIELGESPDVMIDAIYGTGFHGNLSGNALKAAIYINMYSGTARERGEKGRTSVFALDIPSGLGGDVTSEELVDTNSVEAHFTITFHARKPVHLQSFAAAYCGEIIVADIGIDESRLWDADIYETMI